MERITTIEQQQAWSRSRRTEGKRIACVPTMGALHEGHLALVREARKSGDVVLVSLFVNPTQFDNPEDLEAYPQQVEADCAQLEAEGVDAIFLPTRDAMFPNGYSTFVEVVGNINETLCAVARPGHFRGVCTVVTKLFNIMAPDIAVFGRKDLQQLLIIYRMVRDLNMPIEIVAVDTVREADGLAMSSRNARLEGEAREIASAIPRGLVLADRAYRDGQRSAMKLIEIFAEEVLVYPDVDVDYANVVRLQDFTEVDEAEHGCFMAVAVFVHGVRLIDHIALGAETIDGVDA